MSEHIIKKINPNTGREYVVGSSDDPNLNRKKKEKELEMSLEEKNILEKSEGEREISRVASNSYAVFEGVDEKNGYYVFKFLTKEGNKENEFVRFRCGFENDEYARVFSEAGVVWAKSPILQGLPYYGKLRKRHKDGRAKVVKWDPLEYELWRSSVDEREGEDARIYDGKELRKKKHDPEGTDDLRLEI